MSIYHLDCEIRPAFENGCVGRAISTARLALGYKTGLPDGLAPWGFGPVYPAEFCHVMSTSFPDRQILLMADNAILEELGQHTMPDNITVWGKIEDAWLKPAPSMLAETHLWIFGYIFNKKTNNGHIVIGYPIKPWPTSESKIYIVFGIPLLRTI